MRLFTLLTLLAIASSACGTDAEKNRAAVTQMPGLVAFWDFVKREAAGEKRFTAHVPADSVTDYPLDAANYVQQYWGQGKKASYDDFPLLGFGPFGEAVRLEKETDPNFRPFLYVPRGRVHNTPLDIKGDNRSVTVVVWAIRQSGNHGLAGIWHEGTDLKQPSTQGMKRVEKGQRQYALFGGLSQPGSACGHVSENGASSFEAKYALHKSHSPDRCPHVPMDASEEHRYTHVQVSYRKNEAGSWVETDRDLIGVRVNPWWYPHGIYAPENSQSRGPFTIGRVIHSGRSIGFVGWIGGVAVFDRALSATELAALAKLDD